MKKKTVKGCHRKARINPFKHYIHIHYLPKTKAHSKINIKLFIHKIQFTLNVLIVHYLQGKNKNQSSLPKTVLKP